MSKTVITMSAIVLILVLGCAKDIIVEPPTSFAGLYHGEYIFVDSPERGGHTDSQWIKWTFTDYTYIMDTFRLDLRDRFTCDKYYGTYRTENKVIFDTSSVSVGQCDTIYAIRGAFTLDRRESNDPKRDTLIFTQWGPGNIYKKIIKIIKDSIQ